MKCDEVEQLGMHQDKEESKEKGIPEKKEERLIEGEGYGVAKKPLQQQRPGSSSQAEWLAPGLSLVQLQQHLLHLSSAPLVACLFNCGPWFVFLLPIRKLKKEGGCFHSGEHFARTMRFFSMALGSQY